MTAASARNESLWTRRWFSSEIAAPVQIEDANWHEGKCLHQECRWKRGDPAIVKFGDERESGAPPVGRRSTVSVTGPNQCLTRGGLLMEVADYPERYTALGIRIGVDYVVYAMTH